MVSNEGWYGYDPTGPTPPFGGLAETPQDLEIAQLRKDLTAAIKVMDRMSRVIETLCERADVQSHEIAIIRNHLDINP